MHIIKPIATRHSLFIHAAVQVRLGEHDTIQRNIEHDADEHWAIAAGITGENQQDMYKEPVENIYSQKLHEREHFVTQSTDPLRILP